VKKILPWAAAAVLAVAAFAVAPSASAPAALANPPALADSRLPAGFTENKIHGINYVRGGHGPVVVLLHGYPQTWYEWHALLPVLAATYTVVAPDLPGAGKSDAPAGGYDKKTMAADIHGLLVTLGLNKNIRLVGHDIGTMVAYAYAAAHPTEVSKLVLSEAPIPDESINSFPAYPAVGHGGWQFGFFTLTNGLPETMVHGREQQWVGGFIDQLETVKGAVTPDDVRVFGHYLQDPAHLKASFEWFRAFPSDIKDDAVTKRKPLPMPVLAIDADGSLNGFLQTQIPQYASHVTYVQIKNSGHWIYEEHPAEMAGHLLTFFRS
jgi:pimeloyl-ACP methyl ester carboxylesterase